MPNFVVRGYPQRSMAALLSGTVLISRPLAGQRIEPLLPWSRPIGHRPGVQLYPVSRSGKVRNRQDSRPAHRFAAAFLAISGLRKI
jgi:hypothetical protein